MPVKRKKSKSTAAKRKKTSTKIHPSPMLVAIFLLLALTSILSLINAEGFLVSWFSWIARGLVGYGVYILPISFVVSTIIMVIKRNERNSHRITCLFLLPVIFGGLINNFMEFTPDKTSAEYINNLFISGRELKSGGIVAGGLAEMLNSALSQIGATILLVVLFIFAIFVSFNFKFKIAWGIIRGFFVGIWGLLGGLHEDWSDYYEEQDGVDVPVQQPVVKEKKIPQHAAIPPKNEKHIEKHGGLFKKAPKHSMEYIDIPLTSKECAEGIATQIKCDPKTGEVISMPEGIDKATSSQYDWAEYYLSDGKVAKKKDKNWQSGLTDELINKASKGVQEQKADIQDMMDSQIKEEEPMPWEDKNVPDEIQLEEPTQNITEEQPTFIDEIRPKFTVPVIPLNRAKPVVTTEMTEQKSSENPQQQGSMSDQVAKEIVNVQSNVPVIPEYSYPPIDLLKASTTVRTDATMELRTHSTKLIDTLNSFNIEANIINITRGPSVTRYEIQLNRGTKYSRITSLSDDISLSLGASSVRIAPIPDKSAVGIEVPNINVETVYIREVIDSAVFKGAKSAVAYSLGKDINGKCIVGDIAKMPHMLIAGTTGSGKSVCINSMIISLLYKSSPENVRLIMIDPKMIELGCYNGIPHLLIPVVTDPKKAAGALSWAVTEMMRRYKLFADLGVRDLESYNTAVKTVEGGEHLPQIVIVIDELADLMLVAAHEVEESVCRVAQMARAAGMHLIIATQRPSADVITGLMKANIPSRVAFAVASQIESRIILDSTGAEKLIGRGDMLYNPLGAGKPVRIQGCLISSEEVEAVVNYIKQTGTANYSEDVIKQIESKVSENGSNGKNSTSTADADSSDDDMMSAAINVVVEMGQASTSMLQRRLKLGYSRAARIVDQMEERGIVGPPEGSKPRAVLISKAEWAEMTARNAP